MNFNGATGFAGSGSLPPSTVDGDLTVLGKIKASDGALDAPSYTFTSDTKSGLFINSGSGHGFQLSGGSTGGQVQVLKDSKDVKIQGTLTTDSGATFGGSIAATSITTTGSSRFDSLSTPAQPYYKRTAGTQSVVQGTNTPIAFDTFVKEVNTGYFTYSSPVVTVVAAGSYGTTAQVAWQPQDAGYRIVYLVYAGSIVAQECITVSSGENAALSVYYEDYLLGGDTINVLVFSNANPTANISVTGSLSIKKTG